MKIKPNSWHYKLYMFGYKDDLIRYGNDSHYSDYRNGRISKEEYDDIDSIAHIPKDLCTYVRLLAQTMCWTSLICGIIMFVSFMCSSVMIVPFLGLLFGFESGVDIYVPISILVIIGLGFLVDKWIKFRHAQKYAASLLPDEEKEEHWYDIIDVYYSSIKQKMCIKLEVNPKDFE